MEIEKALEESRKPGSVRCPICNEELFSPMDKLCIHLYGKCSIHLEDNSNEENNLFKIAELI